MAKYININEFFIFSLAKARLQMHGYQGLLMWDVLTRINLHLIDEMNFVASCKIDFVLELSTAKHFNSFLIHPSGMKFGTHIV